MKIQQVKTAVRLELAKLVGSLNVIVPEEFEYLYKGVKLGVKNGGISAKSAALCIQRNCILTTNEFA